MSTRLTHLLRDNDKYFVHVDLTEAMSVRTNEERVREVSNYAINT